MINNILELPEGEKTYIIDNYDKYYDITKERIGVLI